MIYCICITAADFVAEVCHNEVFEAQCHEGEVMRIERARYGRMRLGRCVKTDFGYIGCYADVIDVLQEQCSGRSHCSVPVPDEELETVTGQCPMEFIKYLEVAYDCVPNQ